MRNRAQIPTALFAYTYTAAKPLELDLPISSWARKSHINTQDATDLSIDIAG